ncbi:MAG: VOC family protein [Pseudomonadales bacterium]|nr:VOC family protein [Pseudomonadales bacterium]
MIDVIGIDHLYVAVSSLQRAETFYDVLLGRVLGFRKNRFEIGDTAHVQYYNRHFGYVLRPAVGEVAQGQGGPGLHHFCFRVETIDDVRRVASELRNAGIEATPARAYPEYAEDYWATFVRDPDGMRLEITNYRAERRDRHDHWDPGT